MSSGAFPKVSVYIVNHNHIITGDEAELFAVGMHKGELRG